MNVVVTGPRSVGKSSVCELVAERTGLEYVSSDIVMDERLSVYGGLDSAISDGRSGLVSRTGPSVVMDVLNQDDVVFDLAGGSLTNQSEEPGLSVFERLQHDDVHVIGLLPFKSTERSVDLLVDREVNRDHFEGVPRAELREKVKSDLRELEPKLRIVADDVVYTKKAAVCRVCRTVQERISR